MRRFEMGIDEKLKTASNNMQKVYDAGRAAGATPMTADTEMSDTSENPVQNKVIKKYVDDIGLEKGEAEYSVKQMRHPDSSKKNHAYQRGGIALGGATQAGVTEEEYNASDKYKQTTGKEILDYEDTFGFNMAQGDTTKARGRNAAAHNEATEANAKNASTFGKNTVVDFEDGFAAGHYNENLPDSIFEIGVGNSGWKQNAMSVRAKDGAIRTRNLVPKSAHAYDLGAEEDASQGNFRYRTVYAETVDASKTMKVKQAPTKEDEVVRLKEHNELLARIPSVDTEMSDTSENPVQNKVIKKYVDDIGKAAGDTEPFIVTIDYDVDRASNVASATSGEIYEAYTSGRQVLLKYEDDENIYSLATANSEKAMFSHVDIEDYSMCSYYVYEDGTVDEYESWWIQDYPEGPLVVSVSSNDDGDLVSSATAEEIYQAAIDGKTVYVEYYEGNIYTLSAANGNVAIFTRILPNAAEIYEVSIWSDGTVQSNDYTYMTGADFTRHDNEINNLKESMGDIDSALDNIIAIQEALMVGNTEEVLDDLHEYAQNIIDGGDTE
jgi:hypothetical protein